MPAVLDERGDLIVPAAELGALPPGARVKVTIISTPTRGRSVAVVGLGMVAAALAVAVLATHGRQWRWTGFSGTVSLWSWMTLLVQPVALAALTIRLVTDDRGWQRWRAATGAAVLALGLLALGGYAGHWSWTGFADQRLWDWLHLLLFPLVVILLPEWIRSGRPMGRHHWAMVAGALPAFALLVWGGYRWGWTWTGFTGNTFRDWLDLLIAPFLLPAACKAIHAREHLVRARGVDLDLTVAGELRRSGSAPSDATPPDGTSSGSTPVGAADGPVGPRPA